MSGVSGTGAEAIRRWSGGNLDAMMPTSMHRRGTPYGLSSAIYTRDAAAMLRFKEEIRAGMSSINNSTTGAEAHLPFGGNGWSGNGTRESGIWVVDAYTRWQAVNVDLSGKLQKAQMDVVEIDADPDFRL